MADFYRASKSVVVGMVDEIMESEGKLQGVAACLRTIRALEAKADASPHDLRIQRTVIHWAEALRPYLPQPATLDTFAALLSSEDDFYAHALGIAIDRRTRYAYQTSARDTGGRDTRPSTFLPLTR